MPGQAPSGVMRRSGAFTRRCAAPAVIPLVLLAGFSGCGGGVGGASGREVTDGLGRTLRVPVEPHRIVSVAPNVTDLVIALGLLDRLVGVTTFCQLPPEAGAIERVGGLLNPSLEVIQQLRPDLLIATTSGNDPGLASQAEALGLPLYTVHAETVAGVLESAERLADALGDPERGVRLSADLRERLREIERRLEGGRSTRVLYVIWNDPLIVPGAPAFLTDALRHAGAESVTADAPAAWPTYSLESAIARAPEVILTSPHNQRLPEILAGIPAWSGVPAVRTGRIYVVSSFLERPGPGVIRGIEEIARLLHPDRFADLPAGAHREGEFTPQKK